VPTNATIGRLFALISSILITLAPLHTARAQCDAVGSLEGYNAPPGVDGNVNAMVMWDADGPSNPFPNIMAIGGSFQRAGNLNNVNGLVGWDGAQFMALNPPRPTTKLLCTWTQTVGGLPVPRLVQVSGDANAVVSLYNGTAWSTAGTFTGGTVSAATAWFPNRLGASSWLIIAGTDLQIGGVGPCSIVRFDGTTWSNVATVTGGGRRINALAVWDPDGSATLQTDCLAFGGNFDHVTASGSATSGYGNVGYLSFNAGTYFASNMSGGCVGNTSLGTAEVNALQPWTVGSGPKRLVIGGAFATAGGAGNARGLVWFSTDEVSGDHYYALEPSSSDWNVYRLAEWDPDGAGPGASRIAVWAFNSFYTYFRPFVITSAAAWNPLGSNSVGFGVFAMGVWDQAGNGAQPQWLFLGGSGGAGNQGLARINTGNQWIGVPNLGPDVLGNSYITGAVSVSNLVTTNPSGTFIGGAMDYAGELPESNVANFVSGWGGVGYGLNGNVLVEAPFRSGGGINAAFTVIAGGSFTASGPNPVNHIARLTGGPISSYSWIPLGSGLNGDPYAILQFDPDGPGPTPSSIVVGGAFTQADGATANHIAFWNPSAATWSTLTAQGFNDNVNALVSWDPDGPGPLTPRLLAGGSFTNAGGINITRLAWWDGTQWQPFEGGAINGTVNSLMVWPDPANPTQPRLVVGGRFTQAGNTSANNVAVWRTGVGWDTTIGAGVVGTGAGVYAITATDLDGPSAAGVGAGSELIVGGLFDHNFQGDTLANLARWDPYAQRWTAMGAWTPGVSGGPAIKFLRPWTGNADGRSTILVGGNFVRDGRPAGLVVEWTTQPFITSSPPAQNNGCSASNITLTANALGDGLIYRWMRNGVNLNNGPTGTGSTLSGVTTPTLSISSAGPDDSGSYVLNVFNSCGQASSLPSVLTVQRCCGSADFDCDGDVATDADIEAFFRCLAGVCPPAPCTSTADFDGDGDTATDADIEAFFRVLAGGTC
jgi:hypothetical protein